MKKNFLIISVIGAGKLASSLVPPLKSAGYNINSIISKELSDARFLASKNNIPEYSDRLDEIQGDTNVFLLSVPDDQLENLSAELVKSIPDVRGKYFIHFSGVRESGTLKKIEKKGGLTASFHIIQTFPSRKKIDIRNSFASIETKYKKLEKLLFEVSDKLGLNACRIDADKKVEYHLSAVYASNFLVSNLYAAGELFKMTGIKADFYASIEPIIKKTLDNIRTAGTINALSGPVERGDLATIKKHIRLLKKRKSFLRNYIIQSLSILDIKKEQGTLAPGHILIQDYLNSELKKVTD